MKNKREVKLFDPTKLQNKDFEKRKKYLLIYGYTCDIVTFTYLKNSFYEQHYKVVSIDKINDIMIWYTLRFYKDKFLKKDWKEAEPHVIMEFLRNGRRAQIPDHYKGKREGKIAIVSFTHDKELMNWFAHTALSFCLKHNEFDNFRAMSKKTIFEIIITWLRSSQNLDKLIDYAVKDYAKKNKV